MNSTIPSFAPKYRIKTLNSENCNRWRVQSDRANRAPNHLSFNEIVPKRY